MNTLLHEPSKAAPLPENAERGSQAQQDESELPKGFISVVSGNEAPCTGMYHLYGYDVVQFLEKGWEAPLYEEQNRLWVLQEESAA